MLPILSGQPPALEMPDGTSGLRAGLLTKPGKVEASQDGLPKTPFVDVFVAAKSGHVLTPDNGTWSSTTPEKESETNATDPDVALTPLEAGQEGTQDDLDPVGPVDGADAGRNVLTDLAETGVKKSNDPRASVTEGRDDASPQYAPRDRSILHDSHMPKVDSLPATQSSLLANAGTLADPPGAPRVDPARRIDMPLERPVDIKFLGAAALSGERVAALPGGKVMAPPGAKVATLPDAKVTAPPGAENAPPRIAATLQARTQPPEGVENPSTDLRRMAVSEKMHDQNSSGNFARPAKNNMARSGHLSFDPPMAAEPQGRATVTSGENASFELPKKNVRSLQADTHIAVKPESHATASQTLSLAKAAAAPAAMQQATDLADAEAAPKRQIAGQMVPDPVETVKPTRPQQDGKPVVLASPALFGSAAQLAEAATDGPRLPPMPESVAAEARLGLETSSALRPLPTAPHQNPDVPRQIAQQIALAVQGGADKSVEIQLNPVELGRVRISITPSEAGMTVSIVAERPETLDLMRRNAETLAQDFRDIGYGETNFAFGQGAGQQGEKDDDPPFSRVSDQTAPTDAPADHADASGHVVHPGIQTDRVDIRL